MLLKAKHNSAHDTGMHMFTFTTTSSTNTPIQQLFFQMNLGQLVLPWVILIHLLVTILLKLMELGFYGLHDFPATKP